MGGVDKGETVKNFLKTLSDNNRLGILHGVCEKFATLMGAARGEMELTVTSAAVGSEKPSCLTSADAHVRRNSTPRLCSDWKQL